MTNPSKTTWMDQVSIKTLLCCGAFIRLLLIVYAYYHDQWFRVKYTDIDYMIIVDGAKEMWNGGSPFDRTTFRYTPLLAVLMLPSVLLAQPLGKILFAVSDLGAAYYCYEVLVTYATERSSKWMVSLFILFNPIVVNVSTRGNSDMLITFLSLLVLAKFSRGNYFQAASILGFAIHFKIYPLIYALPLVFGLWERTKATGILQRLTRVIPLAVYCGVLAVTFFLIPTYICYMWFGETYLNEAFIYHMYREDHRHNFSPYWLLMYINMARRHLGVGVDYAPGLFAFIPQAVVLFWVSYKLRRNTAHACCVQTILFIAFNKVCTVQYFVWFLPFLAFIFCEPLNAGALQDKRPGMLTVVAVLVLWASTIPLWVITAIPLEFGGKSDFGRLWLVSCLFFLATVGLAAWLARIAYHIQQRPLKEITKYD